MTQPFRSRSYHEHFQYRSCIVWMLGSEIINHLPWVSVLMYRMLLETSNGFSSMSAGIFSSSLGVPRCLNIDGLRVALGPSKTFGQWYPYHINDIMIWYLVYKWMSCLLLSHKIWFTDNCTVDTCGSCGWSTLRTWPSCLKHVWSIFTTLGPFPINIRPSTQRSRLGWGVDFDVPCTCTHGRCYAGDSTVPFLSVTYGLCFVKYSRDTGRWSFPLYTQQGGKVYSLGELRGCIWSALRIP